MIWRRKPSITFALALITALVLVASAAGAAGQLDRSFGPGGTVLTNFGEGSSGTFGYDIAIQEDGKLVAVGYSWASGSSLDFALARYKTNGKLDRNFGSGGEVLTDFSASEPSYDNAFAVAIQQDGKIVAAGGTQTEHGGTDFVLARYNADGSLDTSFGVGGKVQTDFRGGYDAAHGVVIQQDGKLVAAGESCDASCGPERYDFALARYNTDGSLDTSFGTAGKVLTDISGSGSFDSLVALAIQRDGKLVAAGASAADGTAGGPREFALTRYNVDGGLDTSFGVGGKVQTGFASDTAMASAVAVQQDGKIVAAGESDVFGTSSEFALARYNTDGTLDASFGSGGKVTTSFGGGGVARALAVQPDGKLVAAGSSTGEGNRSDFALVRYQTNGSLDASFGAGGKVTTNFSGSGNAASEDLALAVAVQEDKKIVAVGYSHGPGDNFALARYLGA
jgi:uncharacterized delta-60 repeat protein